MDSEDRDLNKAYRLYSIGRYREAIDRIEAILDADPNRANAWQCLGVVHYTSGNFNHAIDCLKTAESLSPLCVCARLALAHCYVRCNSLGRARASFMELACADDVSSKHLPEIARGLGFVGLSGQAVQVCRKLVNRFPNHHQAVFGVAHYMANCEYPLEQVAYWFERAIELAPNNVRYRTEYAKLLHAKGMKDRANRLIKDLYFEQIVTIRCKRCLLHLAELYQAAGDQIRHDICMKRFRDCDQGA